MSILKNRRRSNVSEVDRCGMRTRADTRIATKEHLVASPKSLEKVAKHIAVVLRQIGQAMLYFTLSTVSLYDTTPTTS